MSTKILTTTRSAPAFNADVWLEYFRQNKQRPVSIPWDDEVGLSASVQAALAPSFQRFQVGEQGSGEHLFRQAAHLNNDVYSEALGFMVKEEQFHAVLLEKLLYAMNAGPLDGHWSDEAFYFMRRFMGVRTEIGVLQIAEVIGHSFYDTVYQKTQSPLVRAIMLKIATDETAHLRFNAEFMEAMYRHSNALTRAFVLCTWTGFFAAIALAFSIDHFRALKAMGVSPAEFIGKAASTFWTHTAYSLRLAPGKFLMSPT